MPRNTVSLKDFHASNSKLPKTWGEAKKNAPKLEYLLENPPVDPSKHASDRLQVSEALHMRQVQIATDRKLALEEQRKEDQFVPVKDGARSRKVQRQSVTHTNTFAALRSRQI